MRVDLRRCTFDAVNANFDFFAAVTDDDVEAALFSLLFSEDGRFRPIKLLAATGLGSTGVICGFTSFNGFLSIAGFAVVVAAGAVALLLESPGVSSASFLCSFLFALVHFSV